MTAKDFEKQYATHTYYGEVFVTGRPKAARSMVHITVTQRGPGWDEATEKYRRYRMLTYWNPDGSRTLRWGLTKRDEYGTKDTVHINELKLKNE